jgi:spore germination protein GerM
MSQRALLVAAGLALTLAVGWISYRLISRASAPKAAGPPAAAPAAPAVAERKITATLYYVAEDGLSLVGQQREVPFGDTVEEQARRIVLFQLTAAPAPLGSAVPAGTTLRALFLSDRGDAFVDLSPEISTNHAGGALNELFTVYAIVDALTVNLPAITRVQILIGGKEVDTLAGHVDLRHPLQKNMKWVKTAE